MRDLPEPFKIRQGQIPENQVPSRLRIATEHATVNTFARLNGHTPRKLPVLGVPKRQPFASSHIKLVYYIINRHKLQELFVVIFVEFLAVKTTKTYKVHNFAE